MKAPIIQYGVTMKTFEVTIFNQAVRDCTQKGEAHSQFDDSWADTHYIEVKADSEERARRQVRDRHPERKGFVIRDVTEMKEFG